MATVQLEPHGTRTRIARGGELYAVLRAAEDGERKGAWFRRDDVPKDHIVDFTEHEASLILPLLRALDRSGAGRRPEKASTADGRLIDRVCKALGVTAAALAEETKIAKETLSRARKSAEAGGRPLTEQHRATLRELLAKAQSMVGP